MEYVINSKQDGFDSFLQVSFSLHFLLCILVVGLHPPLSCKTAKSFSLLRRGCEMPGQNSTLWQCEGTVFRHH